MGMLSRILPAPVFRFLKKTINPPKAPQDKSKQYTDLLVILEISRDVMDSSLELLRSLVRSFHDSLPDMIRCEMHAHLIEGQDCTVHLLYESSRSILQGPKLRDVTAFDSLTEQALEISWSTK